MPLSLRRREYRFGRQSLVGGLTLGLLLGGSLQPLRAQMNGSQGDGYDNSYPGSTDDQNVQRVCSYGSGCTCEQPQFCDECQNLCGGDGSAGGFGGVGGAAGGGGAGGSSGGGGGMTASMGGLGGGCATCSTGGASVANPGGGGGGGPGGGANCLPGFGPGDSNGPPNADIFAMGSLIDGISMSYYHWGWDFPRIDTEGVGLVRIHRPRDASFAGSFGPGIFSNYDHTILLNSTGSSGSYSFTAEVLDPTVTKTRSYSRPSNASSTDFATLKPDSRDPMKKLTLLQSNLSAIVSSNTTAYNGAAYVLAERWDGGSILFQLFESGQSDLRVGKPVKFSTTRGDTTLVYKTFTTTELAASPSRAWQIDTVTDPYGNQLGFTYASAQVAGQWVVSSVSVPGSTTRTYNYSSGKLASVDYPLNLQSTFTYGIDADCAATTLTIQDRAADVGHQNKTIYLSNMQTGEWVDYEENGGTTYYNTVAVNSIKMITNGDDEVAYLTARGTSAFFAQYVGGGRMKVIGTQDSSNQYAIYEETRSKYMKTWTIADSGSTSSLSSWFTLTGTSDTEQQLIPQPTTPMSFDTTTADGSECHWEFDTDHYVITKEYNDGTFETFCYNTFKKVTRHRDRLKRVTKYVYDSAGQLTEKHVGLTDHSTNVNTSGYSGIGNYDRCATNDVQTSGYGVYKWQYVASGAAKGQVSAAIDPLNNQTDYQYTTEGRLWKVLQPADTSGGSRPTTVYTYQSDGRLASVTDAESHAVTFAYDSLGRPTTTTYADSTTEIIEYGTSGNGTGLPVKSLDRANVVTTYDYDTSQRLTTKVTAAATRSGGTDTATPYGVAVAETFVYVKGSDLLWKHTVNGALTETIYDYRGRVVETKTYPRSGKTLTASLQYENNQLYKSSDPYGRSTYYAYDATDGRMVRIVQGTVPSYTPPTPGSGQTYSQALLTATRNSGANATYIVKDVVHDAEGQVWKQFDGRNTETRLTYDGVGRRTMEQAAYGTSVEAKNEKLYDAAGNVTELRSPRYFDSSDTNGYNKAKEAWTYNGRNLVATHSEAPGTTEGATESFTYDLTGDRAAHTDFRGKVWTALEEGCCDLTVGKIDPSGHGSVTNADPRKLPVHQVTLANVASSSANYNSPVDADTLRETTTRYDARRRPTYSTTWLSVRGLVSTTNPPIAGLDSVAASDGLTTQHFYDDDLADGVGLDSSGGVSYTKTAASGTSSVSVSAALTTLASATTSGGAGLTFGTPAPGRATVTVNPQDEVSFTIQDAAGRMVMSGKLDNYTGTANNLLAWSCTVYDTVTAVTGYGDCLESHSVDALGKSTKSLTDSAGRTVNSLDRLAKATTYTYDAAGNQLSARDPNNVGRDCTYDALNRDIQCTDTVNDVTSSGYDRAGNKITITDAKTNTTTYSYDARGRKKSETDRLAGVILFTYMGTGQLASLTDAESQTTSYTYSDAGVKLTEQYPDHTSGAAVGTSGYGIVTFTRDAAGRTIRKQDQLGDTCSYNYDLAGRLAGRDYRTAANSPSGAIADSDSFTYNRAGSMLTAASGRYSNTVTYTYDTAGRKATEALTYNSVTYSVGTGYNARNELTQYTYPDSTVVDREYTARGELWKVKQGSTTIDTRTYDDGGRMLASTYNNGVTETRTYNADNTLASIDFGGTGSAIGDLSYGWDDNKNKTSESIAGTMSGYGFTIPSNGYDAEDRLVSYDGAASQADQSWSLSAAGDWNSVTTNGTSQARTHGQTHEILTAASQNITHDVKGNMTLIPAVLRANGQALALTWDFENRMKTADVGNDSSIEVQYIWDARGRRVARTEGSTTTVHVQAGQQTIADYPSGAASSSPTYRYLYASYLDEPILRAKPSTNENLYYHRNQQYSIVALTDGNGNLVERYSYSAYGKPKFLTSNLAVLVSSNYQNRYLYTGREHDDTLNSYHYRARLYDSTSGRFLGRDPIRYSTSSSSIYTYCDASPPNFIDPNGLAPACCTFSDGYNIWSESVDCWRGQTSAQCCSDRAGGLITSWDVIDAQSGFCNRKPPTTVFNYGQFCGPLRGARCRNGQPNPLDPRRPIDNMDAACRDHDCCLGTPECYLSPTTHHDCNFKFCLSVYYHNCNMSPEPDECESYRSRALTLCATTWGWIIPLP